MQLNVQKIAQLINTQIGPIVYNSFSAFASLHKATETSISFSTAEKPGITFSNSKAGCILVPHSYKELPENQTSGKTLLYCDSPYHAIITLLREHHQAANTQKAIHPTASIHDSAVIEGKIEENCSIGPNCVIMKGALVEANTTLEANITIYPGSIIGEHCTIQAGVVIGSRGFGFYTHEGIQKPVPHFGGVVIGSHCTIGANSVIAAGFIEQTQLGLRCHLDSFVQIGHNTTLGNDCIMVSQSGVAGSTVIDDNVTIGGGAQIAGHLKINKGVSIAAKSGVTKNIPAGLTVAGFPAIEISEWRKNIINQRRRS